MRRTWTDRGAALLLVCTLASTSIVRPVLAQTPKELEAARASFKDGLQLEKDGKYEEALEKFEATSKVKTTAQVRFHIGLCNEKLGRYSAAVEAYDGAAKQAQAEGNAPEVLKVAPELATKLREKMPKVTILFAEGTKADSLSIDGKVIELSAAKDIALDPGPHVVMATAGDDKIREEFKVADGESKTITLKAGAPTTTATDNLAYEHPAETPKEKRPEVITDNSSTQMTVGWVLTGVGVASLGASLAFFLVRSGKMNDLKTVCVEGKCPPSAGDTIDSAKTFGTLSGVALGVGVASLGAGIVMLVTAKKRSEPEASASARIVPWSPGSQVGLGIEGAF
jgi:hypothetical protein